MRIRTSVSSTHINEMDQRIADISNALAHPLRAALVRFLSTQNCGEGVKNLACNKDLVEMFDYSQSTISQHINILKRCGLILTERKETFTHYSLNKELLVAYSEAVRYECC